MSDFNESPPPIAPPSASSDAEPTRYDVYLSVEDVQRQLKRSRASVYRYANTSADILNPPFDPQRLNPEVRTDRDEPLQFHIREVRRFARDVLGLTPTLEVQPSEETTTHELLRAILAELQHIRELLQASPRS